jgi:acyl-CoA thioesterase FadM
LVSFVRIPTLVLRQLLKPLPALGILDQDSIPMRVWPQDIDLNLHMNNARYLSVMDYARIHLLARTKLLEHMVGARWRPVVGAVWITYRRSLPLLAAFSVNSRLLCWDQRWFYIEQTFTCREGLAARGWVKGMLREGRNSLDPQQVVGRVAPGAASPPMPQAITQWNELTREQLQAEEST